MEDTLEPRTDGESTHALDPLLQQAINNNGEALNALFSRHRRRLYNAALRVLGNSDDAEDALQDALLSAFRNLRGFKGRSQFSTWVTSIVVNAARMRLRRLRPELTTSIDRQFDPREQPLADRIPDPGPNPEEIYAQQERFQILERRLQSLPVPYRQPLWLCHVEGMSLKEAAEALGVPIGTLKSQLHRARLQLSEEVAEAGPAQRVVQRRRSEVRRFNHDPKRNSCRNRRCKCEKKLGERVTRPAINGLPGLKLAAVATRNEQSAREAAEAFGTDRWFADPFAMIRDDRIDVITIAIKVPAHRELVLAALEAGRAVCCEAPLGRTVAESEEMASAAGSLHTAIGLQGLANEASGRNLQLK